MTARAPVPPVTDDRIRELSRDLPYDPPSASRREEVRASLLASLDHVVQAPPPRTIRWPHYALIGGAALAAAAAIAVLVQRPPAAAPIAIADRPAFDGQPDARAIVSASTGAELEHTTRHTPAGADEQVRVHAGHLRLAVAPLVRLVTSDAVVTGAGVYEVTVAHDSLRELTVRSGGARIALGRDTVFLVAGDHWEAPISITRLEIPIPVPTPTPTPKPEIRNPKPETRNPLPVSASVSESASASASATLPPRPSPLDPPPPPLAPSPRKESAAERLFVSGWSAFRANDFPHAAALLGAAADTGERTADPIASDARYQQAVALSRANQPADAERVIRAFLARYPDSPRRAHAELLLARLHGPPR